VLDTMDRMERHRGHWLNWYDTRSLDPLEPRYVSTVDSGNLAVSLVTLAEGCCELTESAVFPDALWSGRTDALDLLSEALADRPGPAGERLRAQMDRIAAGAADLAAAPVPSSAALDALRTGEIAALEPLLLESLEMSGSADGPGLETIQLWIERSEHQVEMMRSELEALLPWLSLAEGAPAGLEAVRRRLDALLGPGQPLRGAARRVSEVRRELAEARTGADAEGLEWLYRVDGVLIAGGSTQEALLGDLEAVAARAAAANAMDFAMLYDRERRIFNIGYNLNADQLDPHHYDLLMSEARLASYFSIAKRDVPAEHWFHLGRPISGLAGELTALSWNGSMFEFLMPALVLGSQEGRLTGRSEHAVVAVQRRYADRLGLPWGVSESSFALRDSAQIYQYQAFGVPGLGLRRGLGEDYVVALYASGLALAVAPLAAVRNLRRLSEMGLVGTYGMFEAVDFTPLRQRAGEGFTPVRSFMAHHQGMMLTAIGTQLTGDALPRRFMADPRMKSIGLLLQERVPWDAPRERPRDETSEVPELARGAPLPPLDVWVPPARFPPDSLVLGNGRLSSTVTTSGAIATLGRARR
jgi:cyclic beta-1,2-glucan synthetase